MDEENDELGFLIIEGKQDSHLESEIGNLATSGNTKVRFKKCEITVSQQFQRELSRMEELEILDCIIKDRAMKDQHCPNLKRLTINDCNIQFEDISALKMDQLEYLNLQGNQMQGIEPAVFENMKKLKILDLCMF